MSEKLVALLLLGGSYLNGLATLPANGQAILPLYPVDSATSQVAVMALSIDYLEYPNGTSYESYLQTNGCYSPEAALSTFLEKIRRGESSVKATTVQRVEAGGLNDWVVAGPSIRRVDYKRRYTSGGMSVISVNVESDRPDCPVVYDFVLVSTGACFAVKPSSYIQQRVMMLLWLHEANLYERKSATLPPSFSGQLRIPLVAGDSSPQAPFVTVLLNGQMCNTRPDASQQDCCEFMAFVTNILSIQKAGRWQEWLALWTLDEARELYGNLDESDFIIEQKKLASCTSAPVYCLDFQGNAAIYIKHMCESTWSMELLTLWKNENLEYKLTQGVDLSDSSETFSGNVRYFLEGDEMMEFVRTLDRGIGGASGSDIHGVLPKSREGASGSDIHY